MKLIAGLLVIAVAVAFGLYAYGANLEPEVRTIEQEAENVRED